MYGFSFNIWWVVGVLGNYLSPLPYNNNGTALITLRDPTSHGISFQFQYVNMTDACLRWNLFIWNHMAAVAITLLTVRIIGHLRICYLPYFIVIPIYPSPKDFITSLHPTHRTEAYFLAKIYLYNRFQRLKMYYGSN